MREFISKHLNKLERKEKLFRKSLPGYKVTDPDAILEVNDLKTYFPVFGGIFRKVVGWIKAVDGVSFSIKRGETLGLVGESGCGKSTIGRTLIRLYEPTAGSIMYHDTVGLVDSSREDVVVDLAKLNRRDMRPYRADIQMIFQDPYSSLNPRFTVGDIVAEPMTVHQYTSKEENLETVMKLLDKVGLSSEQAFRYPHEFSGGQRQRIGIARALSTNPKTIIADEPVSALDVSVQAQVINLMQDLQEELNLTYIFIAHDLSVVKHISHRIAVMYLGNIVELGPAEQVYNEPRHPYTKALLSAVPHPDPRKESTRVPLEGDVPSPMAKPSGCGFRNRCPIARPECAQAIPETLEVFPGTYVACHFVK